MNYLMSNMEIKYRGRARSRLTLQRKNNGAKLGRIFSFTQSQNACRI